MSKIKTYQEYKEEAEKHNESIMSKYGAPPEAKPPMDKNSAPSDHQFRRMSFTKRRTLEAWPPKNNE